ncbi:hypothetical protein [Bauldia litoralis]|uniref:hypothetical protein n=1 Tax=Bauldia litoralis TaxID=665467 RepID=UPI0032677444
MLARARLYVIAIGGLALWIGPAWSQDQPEPAIEREPIATVGQQESGPTGENDTPEEQPQAPDYSAILESIETAIRELIPEENQNERQRQEQREIDDLGAQQQMAVWAKGVFWATVATVGITMVGLFLIWRTLKHTRRAADYARDMVEEGRQATSAAESATHEAKRQADTAEAAYSRLERPYLFPKIVGSRLYKVPDGTKTPKPHIEYTVANYGKTPAIFKSIFLELRPSDEITFIGDEPRVPVGAPEKSWYEVLASNEETGKRRVDVADSEPSQGFDEDFRLALHGRLKYEDPTGTLHTHHFVLVRVGGRFGLEYSRHHAESPKQDSA